MTTRKPLAKFPKGSTADTVADTIVQMTESVSKVSKVQDDILGDFDPNSPMMREFIKAYAFRILSEQGFFNDIPENVTGESEKTRIVDAFIKEFDKVFSETEFDNLQKYGIAMQEYCEQWEGIPDAATIKEISLTIAFSVGKAQITFSATAIPNADLHEAYGFLFSQLSLAQEKWYKSLGQVAPLDAPQQHSFAGLPETNPAFQSAQSARVQIPAQCEGITRTTKGGRIYYNAKIVPSNPNNPYGILINPNKVQLNRPINWQLIPEGFSPYPCQITYTSEGGKGKWVDTIS